MLSGLALFCEEVSNLVFLLFTVHFLEHFSLEPDCLGVLLSQLVVTLSSLIDNYPKIIAEALNYLIIEHRYHSFYIVTDIMWFIMTELEITVGHQPFSNHFKGFGRANPRHIYYTFSMGKPVIVHKNIPTLMNG